MKATVKFRNEKGQFCSENQNHGFEVENEFCKIVAKRKGQQYAGLGDNVVVSFSLTKLKDKQPIHFTTYLFKENLNTGSSGFWMCDVERNLSNSNFEFNAKTWREAFKLALDYICEELYGYETLVAERENALIDAEF